MYETVTDEQNNRKILKVYGDLTVINILSIFEELKKMSEEEGDVEIELSDIGDVDMTFFQLLCSTHRTFNKANKRLCVTGDRESLFRNREYTGFIRHKGCSRDVYNDCVLVKEK